MYTLNERLFVLLNASDHPFAALLAMAHFIAADLIIVAILVLVSLWIWGVAERRAGLVATTLATIVALGLNQLSGLFWYEPRPFMIGLGHTFAEHAVENSFPSDHATLMFSIGFGLIATGASRPWGVVVCLAGVLVAWARIYLGLHFPIDMISSAVIAVMCSLAAIAIERPIAHHVMPMGNRLYDRTLDLLRFPRTIFPRRSEAE